MVLPPLWCEGDGAPSTRRTARYYGPRRGRFAPPGPENQTLPTSRFLIATALLTIPRILHLSVGTRRGLPSERRPEGALRTTATARKRKIRGPAGSDNQKIEDTKDTFDTVDWTAKSDIF